MCIDEMFELLHSLQSLRVCSNELGIEESSTIQRYPSVAASIDTGIELHAECVGCEISSVRLPICACSAIHVSPVDTVEDGGLGLDIRDGLLDG